MKTNLSQSSTMFKQPIFASRDKTLILNKPKILETILKLKTEESLPTLRDILLDLKGQLAHTRSDKIGLLNIDSNGDTIKVSQKYLLGELDQIADAQTLERARYYIERFEKSITEIKTGKINDINLNRWKEYDDIYTDSLWVLDKRDSSGVHTAGYWGNFIPQIPHQMMRRYTKKGEWILDAFVGCGTTLIESQGGNWIWESIESQLKQR